MNYSALVCALHNNRYKEFIRLLNKADYLIPPEDIIFQHACFFNNVKYVNALIRSQKVLHPITAIINAIPVIVKRHSYETLKLILEHNIRNIDAFKVIIKKEIMKIGNFKEYEIADPYVSFIDEDLKIFLPELILKLKIFLNGRITNKYLIVEIINVHEISKNITYYDLFTMTG